MGWLLKRWQCLFSVKVNSVTTKECSRGLRAKRIAAEQEIENPCVPSSILGVTTILLIDHNKFITQMLNEDITGTV